MLDVTEAGSVSWALNATLADVALGILSSIFMIQLSTRAISNVPLALQNNYMKRERKSKQNCPLSLVIFLKEIRMDFFFSFGGNSSKNKNSISKQLTHNRSHLFFGDMFSVLAE